MKYRVTHKTLYDYNESVSLCHNEAHLLPRNTPYQQCLNRKLTVEPLPALLNERIDAFGNIVNYFSIQAAHRSLVVSSESEVNVQYPPVNLSESPPWEEVRNQLPSFLDDTGLEARIYVLGSPFIEASDMLKAYAEPSFKPGRPLLEATNDLMGRIFEEFTYDPNFTTIVTPLSEVMTHRRGVCQDFAHLMIGCLRSLGLSARYVSGYLETLPPPGQEKLQGSDASHAWLAVYIPGQGWTDFDPTNDQIPVFQHITTAWGRDYSDVTPLKGIIFGGGEHVLTVSVDVQRLENAASVPTV